MSPITHARSPDLSLRMCLVIATCFWIYASAASMARWEFLREAANGHGIAPPGMIGLACVMVIPVLWALSVVSWRVGYDLSRWVRLLSINLVLGIVFGLVSRWIFIVAVAWLKDISLADAQIWSDGRDPTRTVLLWGASVVEDAAQYLVLQGILTGAAFYTRLKAEQTLRAELAGQFDRARLQALRMQANPHFLFNTLSAIAALVRSRPDAAESMIVRLGDLFRASLLERNVEFISLQRELELGVQYLEIQRTRFESRFDYKIALDAGVRDELIPALLLQPLLENAAEHGLSGSDEHIDISINCKAAPDSRLEVVIRNRIGTTLAPKQTPHHGFGLDNVRERLRVAYGDAASLVTSFQAGGLFEARVLFPNSPANGGVA